MCVLDLNELLSLATGSEHFGDVIRLTPVLGMGLKWIKTKQITATKADLSRREIDSDHPSETTRDLLSDEVEVPVLLLSAPL